MRRPLCRRGAYALCPRPSVPQLDRFSADEKPPRLRRKRGPAAAAARTALSPRAGVRSAQSGRPGSSPLGGHRSCGTAPDSHRTSPSLHRPGTCARQPEHTPPSGLRLSVEVGTGGTPLLVRHIKRINASSGTRRQAPSVSSSGGSATRSSVTLATPAPAAPRAGE